MDLIKLFKEQAHESWQEKIDKSLLIPINDFLNQQTGKNIFPPPELIFKIFALVPLNKIRVVILGQDPYIRPNQAMGLAFSVPKTTKTPPSLQNMMIELKQKRSSDLTDWAEQGVFLLNTALTVEEGLSDSHKEIWDGFTNEVIKAINENNDYVIFALWGKRAQAYKYLINKDKHTTITSSHPSPLSAKKTLEPFSGSQPFKKINDLLDLHDLEPIKWV